MKQKEINKNKSWRSLVWLLGLRGCLSSENQKAITATVTNYK